ncbi:thioredoxin domain-containing protein [Leucobacter coleopterorum]|uniref:Thioredoxin domain-containing protein n=1 Tax=Leucobacter coleopterorum TaxID=2714933 RepID=A0ABX6JZC0_9MICO|nr:thioredoxin domain-containing protein [Leucobacter coleopterorum]QIM19261.1 thioredoxin domain-containing protein [Leucobacter coleopterorum]
MANETNGRLTKNERRAQGREQARLAREQEKKREKRNRLFWQGGIVVGVLAILAVVAIVVTQSIQPPGPGPANMASGGVVFGKDLKVVKGPRLESGETRKAPETDRSKLPLDVTVYADYMCPACGAFEQQNGEILQNFVGSGDVKLEVYPINFLDSSSLGSKYSTRAANLFSCVVDQQPDVAFKLHNRLLSKEVQPQEGTTGLTDDQLLQQAKDAGAELTDELKQCVKSQPFASFISANYKAVSEDGVQGLAKGARLLMPSSNTELQPADKPQRLVSTPTVIVNGQQWNPTRDGSLESYLLKVKGEIEQKSADSKTDTSADSKADTKKD